jgi:hypothetical protein
MKFGYRVNLLIELKVRRGDAFDKSFTSQTLVLDPRWQSVWIFVVSGQQKSRTIRSSICRVRLSLQDRLVGGTIAGMVDG